MRGLIVSRALTLVSTSVSSLWGPRYRPQMRLTTPGYLSIQTFGRRRPAACAPGCPRRGAAAAGAGRSGARGSRRRSVPRGHAGRLPVTVGAFAALPETAHRLDEVTAGNGPGNK